MLILLIIIAAFKSSCLLTSIQDISLVFRLMKCIKKKYIVPLKLKLPAYLYFIHLKNKFLFILLIKNYLYRYESIILL